MSELVQKVMGSLGMAETNLVVSNNEDPNLMEDGKEQPAVLAANKDTKGEGGDDEDAESSSSNKGDKEKDDKRGHGTDNEESSYEDDAEDDIEDKLTDLMGESNMSNMPNPCRRPGDMVMIVPCPEHEVDLRANTGFFIMDLSIIAKMTETELKNYIRQLPEIKGCIGGEDCTTSLEEALDDAERP